MAGTKRGTRVGTLAKIGKLRARVKELEAQQAEWRVSDRQIRASEDRFSAIVNSTVDAIIIVNSDGVITFWNDGAAALFGRLSREMLGRPLTDIIPERFRDSHANSLRRVVDKGESRLVGKTLEVAGLRGDGTEFPAELTLSMWQTQDQPNFAGIIRDITRRKDYEDRLKRLALNDGLTGLPNRVLLRDRLNQAISQTMRNNQIFALMYLDLRKFKNINDTLGHAAGDQVLRVTASRLLGCLRESDTAARVGGDEFTVVLPSIRQAKDAGVVALKIIRALRLPFQLDEATCQVDVSIGITLCPGDGRSADRLMKNADEAMYRARNQGSLRIHFHSDPDV